jgi:4-amino-4-deoxy-L-arabinose transferase-like glycosyltransferase
MDVRDVLLIVALLLLGSSAFANLLGVPPFEDEGSQMRWIWRIIEAGEWRQPLSEGKPLEAWPMVPAVMFAPQPIVAIRALHVLCGMLGAVLTYVLALRVSDRATAFASGVLFAVCPFVVYLERFGHSDILMCTAGLWVLLSVIRLVQSPTWVAATSLMLALLLAALSKLPVGFVFLTSMPLALLLMPADERARLLRPPALRKVIVAHVPTVMLALIVAVVAVARMGRGLLPGFGVQDLMGIGMGRYQIGAASGLPPPTLVGELTAQLSWPVVGLGIVGLVASALLNDWRQRWLIVVGVAPLLAIGWLAKFWFSRYLLFTLPPLIIAAASGWRGLSLRVPRYPWVVALAVFALCVGLMAQQSARLIHDPLTARWSPLDRLQYFEGAGSGYGYPQAAQFLLRTPQAPRMVYSLDGHSADQLRTYLPATWRSRVQPVYYDDHGRELRTEEARLANLLTHAPAWIVVSEQLLQRYMEADFGSAGADRVTLRKVNSFAKPGTRAQVAIYEATAR